MRTARLILALFVLLLLSAIVVFFLRGRWKRLSLGDGGNCEAVPHLQPRSFGTAILTGAAPAYHWNLRVAAINKVPGYFLLERIEPAIDGVKTPLLVAATDKAVEFRTASITQPSITIDSSDAFAVLDDSTPPFADGVFPVLGKSEIIQVPGNSIGRVSHRAEDGIENAIDIKAPLGAVVRAIRPGLVAYVEQRYPDAGCDSPALLRAGNKIIVVDDAGFEVVYGHLQQNSALVSEGDRVDAGQPLAAVGNSGKSVLPHLHLHAGGLTLGGYRTIPVQFFDCEGGDRAIAPSLGNIVCPPR